MIQHKHSTSLSQSETVKTQMHNSIPCDTYQNGQSKLITVTIRHDRRWRHCAIWQKKKTRYF